jgi:uncharacterized protein YkwD
MWPIYVVREDRRDVAPFAALAPAPSTSDTFPLCSPSGASERALRHLFGRCPSWDSSTTAHLIQSTHDSKCKRKGKDVPCKKNRTRLTVEPLEARDVPAIVLDGSGLLTITGTAAADKARLTQSGSVITARLSYGDTVEEQSFAAGSVQSFSFLGYDGNDRCVNLTSLPGTMAGGQGNDYFESGNVGNTLRGGNGDDTLVGYTGNDALYGLGGNDYLFGLTGNDDLQGGDGNDFHYGGPGTDTITDNVGTNIKDGLTDGPLDLRTLNLRTLRITDYLNAGGDDQLSSIERAIVDLTNAERARAGLAPLTVNLKLVSAAQHHATNMATFDVMSHTIAQADLPTLTDRLRYYQYSYRAAGENIAWNYQSAESVMNGWMNSSGHRANILNASYTEIGVGVRYNARGEPYYCQVFGRPM